MEHLAFDSAEVLLLREYLIERRHYADMLTVTDSALMTCKQIVSWKDSLLGSQARQVALADEQRRLIASQRNALHAELAEMRRQRWYERGIAAAIIVIISIVST